MDKSALRFGRAISDNLAAAERREWLVTNGIGGYACGTIAMVLTRSYHGLLIAARRPPVDRELLLAKLDDSVSYGPLEAPLFSNAWHSGVTEPGGQVHVESFALEGSIPTWHYAVSDAVLRKCIWMEHGSNATFVRYDLLRGSQPLRLTLNALIDERSHHGYTLAGAWEPTVQLSDGRLSVQARPDAPRLSLVCPGARLSPVQQWYRGFGLARERYRGLHDFQDLYSAALISCELEVGSSFTLLASSGDREPELGGALTRRRDRDTELSSLAARAGVLPDAPSGVQQLVLAADQFIVERPIPAGSAASGAALPSDSVGASLIAGYPWFADWGRDTMISLPGLTLVTGRPELAKSILRTFSHFVSQGMIPNRFPESGQPAEYNTIDATLWYVQAIRHCFEATRDEQLLRELFPTLQEIVRLHQAGTGRYGIGVDPSDGLLRGGATGMQLTWMDAKVADRPVTPREGKPVEVSALWLNALVAMAAFARVLGQDAAPYESAAERARAGFQRFWNPARGFLFDVLDAPGGPDDALRPNQLIAIALPDCPLSREQQLAVVTACERELLTSHGLRSLAPGSAGFQPQYGGDAARRDAAYHQGTVWAWLIGVFAEAALRVGRPASEVRCRLLPLLDHLTDAGLGSVSEIFDATAPFEPRGCIAQAWSVGELLRAWSLLGKAPD